MYSFKYDLSEPEAISCMHSVIDNGTKVSECRKCKSRMTFVDMAWVAAPDTAEIAAEPGTINQAFLLSLNIPTTAVALEFTADGANWVSSYGLDPGGAPKGQLLYRYKLLDGTYTSPDIIPVYARIKSTVVPLIIQSSVDGTNWHDGSSHFSLYQRKMYSDGTTGPVSVVHP